VSVVLQLVAKPVLLNQLLSVHARNRSRVKYAGTKGYFGIEYIWKRMFEAGIPAYKRAIELCIEIRHRTQRCYDADAPLKTILDGIKQHPESPRGIVDDGRTGIKRLTISYRKSKEDGIYVYFGGK
jgi:hypothetical protein